MMQWLWQKPTLWRRFFYGRPLSGTSIWRAQKNGLRILPWNKARSAVAVVLLRKREPRKQGARLPTCVYNVLETENVKLESQESELL